MEDGHGRYVEPASSVKRSLAMYADEPGKAKVPDEFRSKDFGQGARWEVRWRVDGTAGESSSATGPRPRRSWPRSRSGYTRTGTRIPWTPQAVERGGGPVGSRGWRARSRARRRDGKRARKGRPPRAGGPVPGPALRRTERTTMPHRPAAPATRLR